MSPSLSPLGRMIQKLRLYLPDEFRAEETPAPTVYETAMQVLYRDRTLRVVWAVSRGYELQAPSDAEPFFTSVRLDEATDAALRFLDPRAPCGRTKLHELVAEMLVFARATEVRVHERPAGASTEFHVEVRHALGLARAPTTLFDDLYRLVRRYEGFSYSVGAPETAQFWGDRGTPVHARDPIHPRTFEGARG